MSSWPAGSFCLCFFWQVVRHLWSLHMSRNHRHMDLHSRRNVYPTSWFVLSVLFLPGGGTSVVPTCVQNPPLHGLHTGRNVYLTSWFLLSLLFLTGGELSVVLHMSRIPCYMHLHRDRNVYLTSCFILCVLFLTGGETSVVPTCVPEPP